MKKGPLSKEEGYMVLGMHASGATIEEMVALTERSESTVRKFLENSEKEPVSIDMKGWEDVTEQAVSALQDRGIDEETSKELVGGALKKLDLTNTPSLETVLNFALAVQNSLVTVKKYGKSSVVIMNEAASTRSNESREPGPARSQRDAIFRPKS